MYEYCRLLLFVRVEYRVSFPQKSIIKYRHPFFIKVLLSL